MPKLLEIPFPTGGVHEGAAYSRQPAGTTPDARNVRGFDPATGRNRGGQRAGMSKWLSRVVRGGLPVQEINQVVVVASETRYDDLTDPEDFTVTTDDPNANTGGDIRGVAYLSDGSLVAVGIRDSSGSASVWKYAGGDLTATPTTYDTGGNAYAVCVDADDNIIVAGADTGSASIWKLSSALVLLDSRRVAGNGDCFGVAVDAEGKIYVAHERGGSPGRSVSKFPSDLGNHESRYDTGADALGIAVNSGGHAVVVGTRDSSNGRSVWKLDMSNTNQGAATLLGSFDTGGTTEGVCVDHEGNIIVAGNQVASKSVWKIADADSTLTEAWSKVLDTGTAASAVAVDKDGEVFVAANALNGQSVWRLAADDGDVVWVYDDDDADPDIASDKNAIAVRHTTTQRTIAVGGDRDSETTALATLETIDTSTIITQPRDTHYIGVARGSIRRLHPPDTVSFYQGGEDALVEAFGAVQSAVAFGKVYFVDGTNYKVLAPLDRRVTAWTASAGTGLPADDGANGDETANDGTVDSGGGARLIAVWRGRIVLAGTRDDPHNWFMSAKDDPTDFDYSPATETETQAVAGNNSPAGLIGDVITGLVPYSDDLLIFGCDASIWRMTGDPMAGGRIDLVSDITGMAWGRAWCKDPEGFIYFFGSKGGVYRMAPGAIPVSITDDRMRERLADIDLAANLVRMAWDHRAKGLHVFVTPYESGTTVHYFYDRLNDAWWIDSFATNNHNPTCVFTVDGDGPGDRAVLLGGRDGYVRKLDHDADDDDGTAISSYLWIGPIMAGGLEVETRLHALRAVLAEDSDSLAYAVYAGDTPEGAKSASASFSGTFTAGRNAAARGRARGSALWVKLSNSTLDTSWAFETLAAEISAGGRVRKR